MHPPWSPFVSDNRLADLISTHFYCPAACSRGHLPLSSMWVQKGCQEESPGNTSQLLYALEPLMKPPLCSPGEGRIVAFLSQLFFQSIKLTHSLCLCERRVSRRSSARDGAQRCQGRRTPSLAAPPGTGRCRWKRARAAAVDVLERLMSQRHGRNGDVCATGLQKTCSFNPLSSLSFHAA